jgi:hypothetical protein
MRIAPEMCPIQPIVRPTGAARWPLSISQLENYALILLDNPLRVRCDTSPKHDKVEDRPMWRRPIGFSLLVTFYCSDLNGGLFDNG